VLHTSCLCSTDVCVSELAQSAEPAQAAAAWQGRFDPGEEAVVKLQLDTAAQHVPPRWEQQRRPHQQQQLATQQAQEQQQQQQHARRPKAGKAKKKVPAKPAMVVSGWAADEGGQ